MSLCSVSEEVCTVRAREFSGAEGAEGGRGTLGARLPCVIHYVFHSGMSRDCHSTGRASAR